MKFSVLIPTAGNRLELLKSAIESVLRQDYQNWEIVISDNFSEQNIKTYIDSLNEPRIKYSRTDSFVSVTENWNLTIEKCSGDYVVMIGDDDCLMAGYFSNLLKSIKKHEEPELIYTGAIQYVYPKALKSGDGRLHLYTYDLLKMHKKPFLLPIKHARELALEAINFRASYGYNIQFVLIKRSLIHRMTKKGPFFQSPYPDYYAMNALMLSADRILIYPKPMMIIGISPKSFGFYIFNDLEKESIQFLNSAAQSDLVKRLEKVFLPGIDMNTSWLISMETLRDNYGNEFPMDVNYKRYRLLQIMRVYTNYGMHKNMKRSDFLRLRQKLTSKEKWIYALPLEIVTACLRVVPYARGRRFIANRIFGLLRTYPKRGTCPLPGHYENILEVFEKVNPANF